jgi:hypothetical protein
MYLHSNYTQILAYIKKDKNMKKKSTRNQGSSHFYDVDIDKQIYFLKKTSKFIDPGLVVDM